MATAEHKFAERGVGRYALVTVSAEPAAQTEIVLSPQVFEWLKQEYGPSAWEWPTCDAWRSSAVGGVEFALSRVGTSASPFMVTILKIVGHPVHTDAGAVAFATSHATWKAIGHLGPSPSELPPTGPLFGRSDP